VLQWDTKVLEDFSASTFRCYNPEKLDLNVTEIPIPHMKGNDIQANQSSSFIVFNINNNNNLFEETHSPTSHNCDIFSMLYTITFCLNAASPSQPIIPIRSCHMLCVLIDPAQILLTDYTWIPKAMYNIHFLPVAQLKTNISMPIFLYY